MSLKYPDKLEHNNPALPLMDNGQLAGGYFSVADTAARNAIPIAKRKQHTLAGYFDGTDIVVKIYTAISVENVDWENEENWQGLGASTPAVPVNAVTHLTEPVTHLGETVTNTA